MPTPYLLIRASTTTNSASSIVKCLDWLNLGWSGGAVTLLGSLIRYSAYGNRSCLGVPIVRKRSTASSVSADRRVETLDRNGTDVKKVFPPNLGKNQNPMAKAQTPAMTTIA